MRNHAIKLAVFLALPSSQLAFAGPYAEDLSKCLVASASQEDKLTVIKWVIAAASLHPAVKPMTSVSEQELDDANKNTADLLMRLLTVSCRSEAEKALQYEGALPFQTSFQALGQAAGNELFGSPEVSMATAGVAKYLDREKLEALGGRSK